MKKVFSIKYLFCPPVFRAASSRREGFFPKKLLPDFCLMAAAAQSRPGRHKFFACPRAGAGLFFLLLCLAPFRASAASPKQCFEAITGFAKGKSAQSAGDVSGELRRSGAKPHSAQFFVHSGWLSSDFRSADSLAHAVIRNTEILSPGDELARYSASYIPLKTEKWARKKRGLIVLSLRSSSSFVHGIYWETSLKPPFSLSEREAQALFEKIYEEVYGEAPEVMMDLISKANPADIQSNATKILNLKELFFEGRGDKMRELVLSALEEAPSAREKPSKQKQLQVWPSAKKVSSQLREIALRGWTAEQLKTADADRIAPLSLADIKNVFHSKEKIQALDMRLILPGFQVELLTSEVLWRESITPDQIRQLDTAAEGMQYVFVPSFKHWTHDPHSISLSALSESQIMRIDRDAFLRDVFLDGDTFIRGWVSGKASAYLAERRKQFRYFRDLGDQGLGEAVKRKLPEEIYAVIVSELGFSENFEAMGAAERLRLFEAEARMMLDGKLQHKIIQAIADAGIDAG